MKAISSCFSFLLMSLSIYANDTIIIRQNQYFIDEHKNLILSNMDVAEINTTWINSKTHILFDVVGAVQEEITRVEIGTPYNIYMPNYNRFLHCILRHYL